MVCYMCSRSCPETADQSIAANLHRLATSTTKHPTSTHIRTKHRGLSVLPTKDKDGLGQFGIWTANISTYPFPLDNLLNFRSYNHPSKVLWCPKESLQMAETNSRGLFSNCDWSLVQPRNPEVFGVWTTNMLSSDDKLSLLLPCCVKTLIVEAHNFETRYNRTQCLEREIHIVVCYDRSWQRPTGSYRKQHSEIHLWDSSMNKFKVSKPVDKRLWSCMQTKVFLLSRDKSWNTPSVGFGQKCQSFPLRVGLFLDSSITGRKKKSVSVLHFGMSETYLFETAANSCLIQQEQTLFQSLQFKLTKST